MSNLHVSGLPQRQGEALLYTAAGLTRKEAARKMSCSPQNVVMLMQEVCNKLRARNAPEAVAKSFGCGYLKYLPVLLICLMSGFSGMDERTRVRPGYRARVVHVREVV